MKKASDKNNQADFIWKKHLKLLACPECYGDLYECGEKLKCATCNCEYVIRQGVPFLLTHESNERIKQFVKTHLIHGGQGSNKVFIRLKNRFPSMSLIFDAIYPPPPTVNIIPKQTYCEIAHLLEKVGKHGIILNIGSGEKTSAGWKLWKHLSPESQAEVINIDIAPFANVNVVADALRLPFKDASASCMIIQSVLEHIPEPLSLISEIARVTKIGGCVYAEIPFIQGFHPDPNDYQRYTFTGIQHIFSNYFKEIRSGVSIGPTSALCWILREYLSMLTNSEGFSLFIKFISSWFLAPFRYLDYFMAKRKDALRIACEIYYLGERHNKEGTYARK
ncbi:methyltransferase domain-containing protein [bacterium]|nr:methyltransferase domain-containing protein [bacterium]